MQRLAEEETVPKKIKKGGLKKLTCLLDGCCWHKYAAGDGGLIPLDLFSVSKQQSSCGISKKVSRTWTEDGDSSGNIGFSEDQSDEESCGDYENYGNCLSLDFWEVENPSAPPRGRNKFVHDAYYKDLLFQVQS